jgi:hypothetical protein
LRESTTKKKKKEGLRDEATTSTPQVHPQCSTSP